MRQLQYASQSTTVQVVSLESDEKTQNGIVETLESTTGQQMWESDLDSFEIAYNQWLTEQAAEAASLADARSQAGKGRKALKGALYMSLVQYFGFGQFTGFVTWSDTHFYYIKMCFLDRSIFKLFVLKTTSAVACALWKQSRLEIGQTSGCQGHQVRSGWPGAKAFDPDSISKGTL